MSANKERKHSGNYDAAFKNLEAKVDLLVSELIEGNKDLGRDGHVKRTERRLTELEKKMDAQLCPDQVRIITKAIDLCGSYRFVFGMLVTSILALTGLASMVLHFIKFLKGG